MQKQIQKRAVFLDRDGTINEEVGYINHPDRFRLLPNSGRAICKLNEAGFRVIVVTNQAGVARGYFDEKMVLRVHQKMFRHLAKDNASIDALYYCPHHPDVGENGYRLDCRCRKPKPGMIERANQDFDIDMTGSFMIGDRNNDIKFGKKLGLTSIMVLSGYGLGEYENQKEKWKVQPDYIVGNLLAAVNKILK